MLSDSILDQPENMHFHLHAFSGWGTSKGPKLNMKAFFLSNTIFLLIYIFLKHFGSYLTKSKKDFPMHF